MHVCRTYCLTHHIPGPPEHWAPARQHCPTRSTSPASEPHPASHLTSGTFHCMHIQTENTGRKMQVCRTYCLAHHISGPPNTEHLRASIVPQEPQHLNCTLHGTWPLELEPFSNFQSFFLDYLLISILFFWNFSQLVSIFFFGSFFFGLFFFSTFFLQFFFKLFVWSILLIFCNSCSHSHSPCLFHVIYCYVVFFFHPISWLSPNVRAKGLNLEISKKKSFWSREKNLSVWTLADCDLWLKIRVDSGWLRVARGGSGAKAPLLAARPAPLGSQSRCRWAWWWRLLAIICRHCLPRLASLGKTGTDFDRGNYFNFGSRDFAVLYPISRSGTKPQSPPNRVYCVCLSLSTSSLLM